MEWKGENPQNLKVHDFEVAVTIVVATLEKHPYYVLVTKIGKYLGVGITLREPLQLPRLLFLDVPVT